MTTQGMESLVIHTCAKCGKDYEYGGMRGNTYEVLNRNCPYCYPQPVTLTESQLITQRIEALTRAIEALRPLCLPGMYTEQDPIQQRCMEMFDTISRLSMRAHDNVIEGKPDNATK